LNVFLIFDLFYTIYSPLDF